MKFNSKQIKHLLFLLILGLLIYPKTRLPIQVFINRGLAQFSPSTVKASKRQKLENYNWKLINEEGQVFDFNRAKEKVVIINFWATWCPPCIAEMPSLKLLYDDYQDQVEFVFVSNEDFDVSSKFLEKNNYTFQVYKSMTAYPALFKVSEIPHTILLDKQGYLIINKTGAANWNASSVRNTLNALLE